MAANLITSKFQEGVFLSFAPPLVLDFSSFFRSQAFYVPFLLCFFCFGTFPQAPPFTMRLPLVLLLASLISAGPLPQKTGLVHRHHLHARDDMPAVTDSKPKSTSTTETKDLKKTDSKDESKDDDKDESTKDDKKDESETSDKSDMPSATALPSTTDMPSASKMPSFSEELSLTTLYSYDITVPPSVNTGAYSANPYVHRSLKPANMVFIIVGGILGLLLLLVLVVWFAFWLISRHRAKNERAVYLGMHTPGGGFHLSLSSFLLNDGNLSIAEKSSSGWGSNSSVLMLHRQSLTLTLDKQSVLPSQGRSYREMLGMEHSRRGSMYISPVLEMMHGRSRLQVDLVRPDSIYGLELPYADSPLPSPMGNSSTDAINTQPLETQEKKKLRPPSQLLDDLLGDGMDFTMDPAKR